MEQARYWMWTRTRCSSSSRLHGFFAGSSNNETWEEKAFAEDTAGHLGGCIWPPRSYSCSFCRREFRSAQALGGHMNVHRRDRARLRQLSFTTQSGETTDDQQHPNPPTIMMGAEYHAHQVSRPLSLGCTAEIPNPNSSALAISPVFPRVSADPSTQQSWSESNLFSIPSFSSSITRENKKESLEKSTHIHLLIVPELIKTGGEDLGSREFGSRKWTDPAGVCDEETHWNKRMRTDPPQQIQSEVLKHNPVEELDLELRLGGVSKI